MEIVASQIIKKIQKNEKIIKELEKKLSAEKMNALKESWELKVTSLANTITERYLGSLACETEARQQNESLNTRYYCNVAAILNYDTAL